MKQITIGSADAGQRFDKYLNRILPGAGTSFLYKMLRKKNIVLNGKKATGKEIVKTGDEVKVFFSDETYEKFSKSEQQENKVKSQISNYEKAYQQYTDKVKVLYEDENIIAFHKPIGILSQATKPGELSLNEYLIGYLLDKKAVSKDSLLKYKPSVAQRLDRNTSGIVLCGITLQGLQLLSELFREKNGEDGLEKYYHCRVHGKFQKDGIDIAYWKKNESKNMADIKFRPEEGYIAIKTGFTCDSYDADTDTSELTVRLYTGKSHQIRAHAAALGHPLVADAKYGGKPIANQKRYELTCFKVVFPIIEGNLSDLSKLEISL